MTPETLVGQFGIVGLIVYAVIKLYNDQKAFTNQVIEDNKKDREEQNQFINKIMAESEKREGDLKVIINDQNEIIQGKLERVLVKLGGE